MSCWCVKIQVLAGLSGLGLKLSGSIVILHLLPPPVFLRFL